MLIKVVCGNQQGARDDDEGVGEREEPGVRVVSSLSVILSKQSPIPLSHKEAYHKSLYRIFEL